jgi:hypothetical protein
MGDLDDDAIARLGHLNHLEFSRESVRWSGRQGEVVERDGVLLLGAATDFPVAYNAAARLEPDVPAADVLAVADAFFAAKGRGYSVMISSYRDLDEDLVVAAEAAGHLRVTDAPEMVVREPVERRDPPAGIELGWVTDLGGVHDFFAVGAAAYTSLGLPAHVAPEAVRSPERFLEPHIAAIVATRDDEPVAAAMTLLSHGIAGVYWVATLESVRGQGLADLVTREVTNRGFELGALVNTLQASPMGAGIYERMGYAEIYRTYGYTRFDPPPS